MAKAFIDDTNLTNIANAIRTKLGVSTQYLPSEMAGAIQSIPKRKVVDFNITPKTLNNAEQNSLQYVKAYGKCEQNGTPTPEHPVDIVCNNGVLKVSKNLFDKNNLPTIITAFIPSSGTLWQYVSAGYSLRIPCLPNTTYTARYNGTSHQAVLSFGSTNNDIIPSENNTNVNITQAVRQNTPTINTPITLTTAADDKWLIVQYNATNPQNTDMRDNLQIEVGSIATTYHSYGEIYTEGNTETIKISSENLVDFTSLTIVPNKAITENGELISNNGVNFCESYIPVLPNQTYKISGDILGGTIGQNIYNFRLASYDVDKIFISRSDAVSGTEYTFTTDSNTRYIRFHYINTATLNTYKLQLDNIATCEHLLALPGYTDTHEILSGVVNRKIGIKVLDGTEDWELQNANRSVFAIKTLFPVDFASNPDNNIGLCTHFTVIARSTTVSSALEDGQMAWNTTGYLVMRHIANLGEVANFKQYLANQYAAGTPVIIVYPLKTPTTETVTAQSMQTVAGDNTLEITQSALSGLEVECEYFLQ